VVSVVYTIEIVSNKQMAILESAIFWIVLAAASEIIALSPLKDNSIIQLVFHTLKTFKAGKKI
tara:strand:+ start:152 stop:340 length:189 start_codon:yes stop_codon:yes gene_type:complete